MKKMLAFLGLSLIAIVPLWPQTKPQPSKNREVLALYETFVIVDERLRQLEHHSQQLDKDLKPFLESDSALNQLTRAAMLVGALKAWIPEIRDLVAEEDSLITKLVTSSAGLTGDSGRHADEGIRLLREQHVYLKQSLDHMERLVEQMLELFRTIREDRLADLPELLDERQFAAELKAIEELDQKQELVLARAKDAFLRLKATLK